MDGWMDGWMDGCMEGWMDGRMRLIQFFHPGKLNL